MTQSTGTWMRIWEHTRHRLRGRGAKQPAPRRGMSLLLAVLLIMSTSVFALPAAAISPGHQLTEEEMHLDISFGRKRSATPNTPSSNQNPDGNWASMVLRVDFDPVNDYHVQSGDYIAIGIPQKYFFDEVLKLSDVILKEEGKPETAIGECYFKDDGYFGGDHYTMYIVFNGADFDAGFVAAEMEYSAFSSPYGGAQSATFYNSVNISYDYKWNFTGPTVNLPGAFYKYGNLMLRNDPEELDKGKHWFYDKTVIESAIDPRAHAMSWDLYINAELDKTVEPAAIKQIAPPVVTDQLGDHKGPVKGLGNELHDYLLRTDGTLCFVIYEFDNFAEAYIKGETWSYPFIRYTNLENVFTGKPGTNINLTAVEMDKFVSFASDMKSVSFDLAYFAEKAGHPTYLDKTYLIRLYTVTNENSYFDESNENAVNAQSGKYTNSITVEGVYKNSDLLTFEDMGIYSGASGSYGYFQLKKVESGTSTGLYNAKFDLYMEVDAAWVYQVGFSTKPDGTYESAKLKVGNYRIIETAAPEGYDLDETPHDFTLTAAHTSSKRYNLGNIANAKTPVPPPTTSLTVSKVWHDEDSPDRPTYVEVQLYKDGVPEGFPEELSAANTWTLTWDDLDAAYEWTVDEVHVPDDYIKTITGSGTAYAITNTYVPPDVPPPPTTALSVSKVWEDEDSPNRPASVEVQLYRDGDAEGLPETLSAANAWAMTWDDLDAAYVWTVDEVDVPEGYTKIITGNETAYVITNVIIPKPPTVSLSAQKVWDDEDDPDRPISIYVQLYRDGEAYGPPQALNAGDGWAKTWDDLDAGYVWVVDEVDVPEGYTKDVTTDGEGYTITNTKDDPPPEADPEPEPEPDVDDPLDPDPDPDPDPEPEPEPPPRPRPRPEPHYDDDTGTTTDPDPEPIPEPRPTPAPVAPPRTPDLEQTPTFGSQSDPGPAPDPSYTGDDPYAPPTPSLPGRTLAPDGDGYIELDENDVPLGRWDWDPDEGIWIFNEFPPPLAALPKTGALSAMTPLLCLFGLPLAGIGVASYVKTRKRGRHIHD